MKYPIPLVKETVALLEASPNHLKKKVYFIHMNHTNPMLNPNSTSDKMGAQSRIQYCKKGQSFGL
jgi:pyrroloquinoline quinone biosynthesis protein B